MGAALTAITKTIVASLNPTNYFFYRLEDRDKWTYPLAGVVGKGPSCRETVGQQTFGYGARILRDVEVAEAEPTFSS